MKTKFFNAIATVVTATALAIPAMTAVAQSSSADYSTQTTLAAAPPPRLAYGVDQVLQLAQAKVGDDTIIAFIKGSGNCYGLKADQIIYLRQQGLSSAVLNAMLSQPKPGVLATAPATTVPATTAPADPAPATVTYVQTQPAVTYYYSEPANYNYGYQPYCYPGYVNYFSSYANSCWGSPFRYSYYPGCGWGPNASCSFGWGGHWGNGGGWHGGYDGGGFRGGGFGGGFHSGGIHGGGFHGGGRR